VNSDIQKSPVLHCVLQFYPDITTLLCYRYVILVWQNGRDRLQHRPPLANDMEQLLIWHRKCSEMPAVQEQSNMMYTALAFFCGKSCQERYLLKMVQIYKLIASLFVMTTLFYHSDVDEYEQLKYNHNNVCIVCL